MTVTASGVEAFSIPVPETLVARVRAQSPSIAAEAVRSVHGPMKGSQPRIREKMQHTVQIAYSAIDRVLRIVEGKPSLLVRHIQSPAGAEGPEALTVSSIATAQTWQMLLRGATPREREQLLTHADLVFKTEHPGGSAHQDASTRSCEAERLADALIRQDDIQELTRELNIHVANAYLVVVFGTGHTTKEQREHAAEILAAQHDALVGHKAGQPVVLLPLTAALPRSRVRELAERSVLRALGADATPAVTPTDEDAAARAGAATAAVAQAGDPFQVARATDEALSILQVVDLLDHPAGVYQLDDVPIEVSLLRSPDLANLLALRLAPLNGSGAPLFNTLKTYLDTVQDRRRTARILSIHPNTLDYRLRRIKELTGLSPTAPRDIQTLGAAIAAWKLVDVLGETAA